MSYIFCLTVDDKVASPCFQIISFLCCFLTQIKFLVSSGQVKQLEMELQEVNRKYAMLLNESKLMDSVKVEELQTGR